MGVGVTEGEGGAATTGGLFPPGGDAGAPFPQKVMTKLTCECRIEYGTKAWKVKTHVVRLTGYLYLRVIGNKEGTTTVGIITWVFGLVKVVHDRSRASNSQLAPVPSQPPW